VEKIDTLQPYKILELKLPGSFNLHPPAK
jgi:hypothetical protein